MVVLDTQKEIVLRELEVLTEHIYYGKLNGTSVHPAQILADLDKSLRANEGGYGARNPGNHLSQTTIDTGASEIDRNADIGTRTSSAECEAETPQRLVDVLDTDGSRSVLHRAEDSKSGILREQVCGFSRPLCSLNQFVTSSRTRTESCSDSRCSLAPYQHYWYVEPLLSCKLREATSCKCPSILIFSVNTNHESVAYRSFSPSKFEARGARKVTTGKSFSSSITFELRRVCILMLLFTGITGLWQPSVHSDFAFRP